MHSPQTNSGSRYKPERVLSGLFAGGQSPAWLASLALLLSFLFIVESHADGMTIPNGASFSLGDGVLDLGCADLMVEGSVDGMSGTLMARDVSVAPTGLLLDVSGRIEVTGDWLNSGTFVPGTGTVEFTDGCGIGLADVTGVNSFYTLSVTSGSGKEYRFPSGVTQTVEGTFTVQGVPGFPVVLSSSGGSAALFDLYGEQSISHADTSQVTIPGLEPEPEVIRRSLPLWLYHHIANQKKDNP